MVVVWLYCVTTVTTVSWCLSVTQSCKTNELVDLMLFTIKGRKSD